MVNSDQTLHGFVLNLLSDPQALSAFQLDPEGTLHHAGLSDISAEDVQEVIPLVVDYAPVHGLGGLDHALGDLHVDTLQAGHSGAVAHLTFVTKALSGQLPSPEFRVGGVAHFGDHTHGFDAAGGVRTPLGHASGVVGFTPGHGLHAGFEAAGDVTDTLDSGAFGTAASTVTSALANPTGTAQTVTNAVTGATDIAAGALTNPASAFNALASQVGPLGAVTPFGVPSLPAAALPAHLPTELPSNLPVHLPAGVPALPADPGQALQAAQHAANDALSHAQHGSVTDLVTSHLPVGHLPTDPTQLVHDVTSTVTGVVGQTGLGDAVAHSPVADVVNHSPVADVVSHSPVGDSASASPVGTVNSDAHAGLVDHTVHGVLGVDLHLGL
ncbi:hypothetical protein F0L68_14685 [Solihabitans fulvus]|uniref:Uncharacterized protein n=1 Tax=Solihabitans fulvus TaxID=1892852 RepID=A0A5B2XFV0_9PSEU|nr:IniB N-terminal domain-containing protein [Solihabitans fulvus]KAA2261949.1 hypothetical protein F0L68_14685 [Solihabitans fulvus]